MKKIMYWLLFLAIISSCKCEKSNVIIESYDMKVVYDTSSGYLTVKAKIALNVKKLVKREFHLLFSGMAKISKSELSEKKSSYTALYRFIGDTIILKVPEEIKEPKNLFFEIEYQLPNDSVTINNAVCLFRSSKWCPLQYDVLSKWRIEIKTPLHFKAISSGELIKEAREKNHWVFTWEFDYNSGVPLMIVPENFYIVTKRVIEGTEFELYLINQDFTMINKIFAELSKSFKFYSGLFGPYRNKHIKLIEFPDTSSNGRFAMSLETFMIVGSSMLMNINNPQIGVFWVSHEIAHQWIGTGYVNSFNTNLSWFIEEGLTEYIRLMFIEHEYGKDSMNTVLKSIKTDFENQYLNTEFDLPLSSNNDGIAYIKGPLVFHYVRSQIGDENWKTFLRTMYNSYYGKVIDYEIFKTELSKFDKNGKVIRRMEEMTGMKGISPNN